MVADAKPVFHLGFQAGFRVAFGILGEIVMVEKDTRMLRKYQIQPGSTYVNLWSRDLHEAMDPDCIIEITSSGTVFLQNSDGSPVMVLSPDGSKIVDGWNLEGKLITCFSPRKPVFVREKEEGEEEHQVVIVEEGQFDIILEPEEGRWSNTLSVCQDGQDRIVILDTVGMDGDATLEINTPKRGKSSHNTTSIAHGITLMV